MTNWKEHKEFQQALQAHLSKRGFLLNGNEVYTSGIDCVFVRVQGETVFIVGLPPVSNYPVEETEYTVKYLRTIHDIAV